MDIKLEERLRYAIHNRIDTKRLLDDISILWGRQLRTDPQEFSIELRKALICLDEAYNIAEERVEQLKDEADKTYSSPAMKNLRKGRRRVIRGTGPKNRPDIKV